MSTEQQEADRFAQKYPAPAEFEPGPFSVEVQSLATDLESVESVADLPDRSVQAAGNIAYLLSKYRNEIDKAFPRPDTAPAREITMGNPVGADPEEVKKGFEILKADMATQNDLWHRIGGWVHSLPKKPKQPIDADAVASRLFGYKKRDELAFTPKDRAEAKEYIDYIYEHEKRGYELSVALSDPAVGQHAAEQVTTLLKNQVGKPMTKNALKNSVEYRTLMNNRFPGISDAKIDELFDTGWTYLKKMFKNLDPDYKLFDEEGRGPGKKYALVEDDLKLFDEIWALQHGIEIEALDGASTSETIEDNLVEASDLSEAAELDAPESPVDAVKATEPNAPAERVKTEKPTAIRFDGKTIRFSDGSVKVVNDKVAEAFHKEMEGIKFGERHSRARIVDKIAKETGVKKAQVEQEVKNLVKTLGKGMVIALPSKHQTVMLSRGESWR